MAAAHGATSAILSTFTAGDGENLALYDWPAHTGFRPRGMVLLVHGLGEHMGRYEKLARRLGSWGFEVRGYDQYGHGESGGPRGGLTCGTRLLDDLGDIVDDTRAGLNRRKMAGTRLILLGHSLGGLVAARFVSLKLRPVDALVLSSPALDAGLSGVQKFLVATLPKIAPNLRVGNGLDARYLSHDPAVMAAYRADPRVHDRIAARLALFIADAGRATLMEAPRWNVPTLVMWAGQDKLVNPAGSRAFADAAPKQALTSKCFDGLYHEIFNEQEPEPVFAVLKAWLDQRFIP
ncbi:MAG: lysophospholipase [Rhodoferax sp.]